MVAVAGAVPGLRAVATRTAWPRGRPGQRGRATAGVLAAGPGRTARRAEPAGGPAAPDPALLAGRLGELPARRPHAPAAGRAGPALPGHHVHGPAGWHG